MGGWSVLHFTYLSAINRSMKKMLGSVFLVLLLAFACSAQTIPNPLINYNAFLDNAQRANTLRESRRLTEDKFLNKMAEPGVVILDARSASKFQLRHLKGAVNLSFPDFTADALAVIIPTKGTEVLIYCNNNFVGSPTAFATKAPAASLNISTFVNLYSYGYTNIYELGPLLDVKTTKLPFAGDEVSKPTNNQTKI
jgi:phage shock protein E